MNAEPPRGWISPNAVTAPPGADSFTGTPLFDLLCAAVERAPLATALTGQASSLSYAHLLRLARNAASAIENLVPLGRPVACLPPRTPEAMAGLLGCLISGRLCMVVNPANPAERLRALLDDAAPAALLLAQPLPFQHELPVLLLDAALAGPGMHWRPAADQDPDAPFAVHFTSGSTGRPKGIVLSARAVLYRGLHTCETFALTEADRICWQSVPVESSGLSVLLAALAKGARVILCDVAAEGAGAALRLLEREAATIMTAPARLFKMLSRLERSRAAYSALRILRIGAGALPTCDLADWRDVLPPDCAIHHAYGSTEALVMAQWYVPRNVSTTDAVVAAGMLQPENVYAIASDDGQPVAPGETGELVVRGRYLALGEWQGGKLVPGRMTPVPDRPGWREFRTGDLVRLPADGLLRVMGRADQQVKINGVRIEPAEIEAVLRDEPAVTDAVVIARHEPSGVTLHGFVVATTTEPEGLIVALRQRLATALPSVMRPARLTVLDRLPTLPGGKVDFVTLRSAVQGAGGVA